MAESTIISETDYDGEVAAYTPPNSVIPAIIIETRLYGADRRTSELMSEFEYQSLITARITSLNDGAPPLINDVTGMNAKRIAELELNEHLSYYAIKRSLPNATVEVWSVKELVLPRV